MTQRMSILFIPVLLLILFLAEQALYSRFWYRGLSSRITFQSRPVTEGEAAVLTEVITNRSRLPLPVLQVNFQLGRGILVTNTENVTVSDKTNMTELFSLRPWQQVTRELTLDCRRRGYYRITGNSLIAGDLFANQKYYMDVPQESEMYVYPRMIDAREMEIPFSYLMGEVRSRQLLFEDAFTFRGIRDYAPTDPMGRINWKASARTGDMKVNLREYTTGQQVVILLNLEPPRMHYLDAVLEDGIRWALTLAARLLSEQIPVGMLSNGRDIMSGQTLRIDPGSSPAHLTVFCEGLSRIDLEQEAGHFAPYLRREVLQNALEPGFAADGPAEAGDVTFVLISPSRQPETVREVQHLADLQGRLLWICPVTKDMEQEPLGAGHGIEMFVEPLK